MTSGYLAPPDPTGRPGVVVLHSWWGLDDTVRNMCNRLADAGYAAMAPDLFEGKVPADEAEARHILTEASPDHLAQTVMVSIEVLASRTDRSDDPVAVIGFGMGGSLALWVATRRAARVSFAASLYGGQSIDFDDVTAAVQLHFSELGGLVEDEEKVTTEAFLHLGGTVPEVYHYDGVADGFAEVGRDAYEEAAAELAWDRILAGLAAVATTD